MNARFIYVFLLAVWPVFAALFAQPTPPTCLGFEDIAAGTYYNANSGYEPGDVFLEAQGITGRLARFVSTANTEIFGDVSVQNNPTNLVPPFALGQGRVLHTAGATVRLNFPAGTNQVCFRFWAGDGPENISVNGQPLQVVNFPFNIPSSLAPGVTFTITPASPGGTVNTTGIMCLTGNIESLRIGGQNFYMDEICHSPGLSQPCPAMNLQVEALPCTPNGLFYVAIAHGVTASNTASGYRLLVNGDVRGNYSYAQNTINLGPFSGDGVTPRTFVIEDNLNPACRDTFVLAPVHCATNCGVADPQVEIVDCSEQGYTLRVNFQLVNPSAAGGFTVAVAGAIYGPFSMQQLPLILPNVQVPTNSLEFAVLICPITIPAVVCCRTVMVAATPCPTDECIGFENMTGTAYGASQGNQPGDLIYTENNVPVRLLPFQDSDWVTVFGALSVETAPGTPPFPAASGKFLFLRQIGLAFNFTQYPGPVDTVTVQFFNQGPVNFAANGGPLLSLPLLSPGTFNIGSGVNMKVVLTGSSPQYGTLIFTGDIYSLRIGGANLRIDEMCVPQEPVCELGDATVIGTPACETPGDERYVANIRIEGAQPGEMLIVRSVLTGQRDTLPYGNDALRVRFFHTDNNFDRLVICSSSLPDCCTEVDFDYYCPPCEILGLNVVPQPCNDDGTFDIVVRFDYLPANTLDSFLLTLSTGLEVEFALHDLPFTIPSVSADAGEEIFVWLSSTFLSCGANAVFVAPDCSDDECRITDISATPQPCNDDGQFLIDLSFNSANTGSAGFFVFADGAISGPHSYSNAGVTVGPFPGNGTNIVDILILDISNPACYGYIEVGPLHCDDLDCNITELSADASDCNDADEFFVELDFIPTGNHSTSFTVRGNGVSYGQFDYDELPIRLGPFGLNTPPVLEFIVRDLEAPETCRAVVTVERPACNPIIVWPGDANNDNIANNFDLLNVGVAFGTQGPARNANSSIWSGMAATPWQQNFNTNDLNYAYADCTGNGLINTGDVEAIRTNYNLTHGTVAPYTPLPATPNNPRFIVDMPAGPIAPGTQISAPILLGSSVVSVEAIYGIAFTIEFNPDVFVPSSVNVELLNTSWLAAAIPGTVSGLISINRSFAEDGIIEVAISRINHQNIGGQGVIAHLRGIIDDIAGITESEIRITKIRAIRADETPLAIYNPVETFSIGNGLADISWMDMFLALDVHPNPTGGEAYIENEYNVAIDEVRIYNDKGVQMGAALSNTNRVALSALPAGMYYLKIRIGDQIFHKRVVKI